MNKAIRHGIKAWKGKSKLMNEKFSKADELLQKLSKLRPLTSGEVKRLQDEFLVEFTYNSNAIEGNTLTLEETAMVVQDGLTIAEKPLKDHLEAIGNRDAYLYMVDLVKEKAALSEKMIRDIHSLVLVDQPMDRGVYRKVPVMILNAKHKPPQPYLVPMRMEELIIEYQEKMNLHPIERAAWFHLRFESIHPFIDGNGRTGRLLLNLELMKSAYPPINIKFADRRKYYDCFSSFEKNGDVEEMLDLINNYTIQELERYINILS